MADRREERSSIRSGVSAGIVLSPILWRFNREPSLLPLEEVRVAYVPPKSDFFLCCAKSFAVRLPTTPRGLLVSLTSPNSRPAGSLPPARMPQDTLLPVAGV